MKKSGFLVVGIIIVEFFLNGCDTITGTERTTEQAEYYYYEAFLISKPDFISVPIPSSKTFGEITSFRDSLKNYSVEFLGSGEDATQNDIYTILTQSGMTSTQINNEISLLNSVGNNIGVFEYLYDSSLYIIVYVEKEEIPAN
ncbi:MAG: hypothetical protein LBG95_04600 [Treponema sp.]|jgi:hypothetical protein|nr:hypothetical protein [Treponema sp.]